MAADLNIHVLTNEFTEDHFKAFQSNTLTSKYFLPGFSKRFETLFKCDLFELCADTPSVWVGEVSWLKAAISGDSDTFIPQPVLEVSEIIGEEFPVIDDELIEKIRKAIRGGNATSYSLASAEEVISFLNDHKGEMAFAISW